MVVEEKVVQTKTLRRILSDKSASPDKQGVARKLLRQRRKTMRQNAGRKTT